MYVRPSTKFNVFPIFRLDGFNDPTSRSHTESTGRGHFTTHCLLLKNIGGHLRGKMMEILTPFENLRSGLEEEVKPGGENMKKNRRESSSN